MFGSREGKDLVPMEMNLKPKKKDELEQGAIDENSPAVLRLGEGKRRVGKRRPLPRG